MSAGRYSNVPRWAHARAIIERPLSVGEALHLPSPVGMRGATTWERWRSLSRTVAGCLAYGVGAPTLAHAGQGRGGASSRGRDARPRWGHWRCGERALYPRTIRVRRSGAEVAGGGANAGVFHSSRARIRFRLSCFEKCTVHSTSSQLYSSCLFDRDRMRRPVRGPSVVRERDYGSSHEQSYEWSY